MLLPKLSGPEVLRALRKDAETARIPVMVLTSLPQCNEHKLIKEGATSYFAKSELMLDKGTTLFADAVERECCLKPVRKLRGAELLRNALSGELGIRFPENAPSESVW
jgi:CheY-like chemotaxis protein